MNYKKPSWVFPEIPVFTPEQTRRARFRRDLSELQAAARGNFKPALDALAEMKAEHPDLWAEYNVQDHE